MLGDGTSGMPMIKRSGGIAIIQDTNEASYLHMLLLVLDSVVVEHNESLYK
jgi:hypothetical protein